MIILGIDPGLAIVGWGIIKKKGDKISCLDYGCIKTNKKPLPQRLAEIHENLKKIIKKYKPDEIAVEELFFAKNAKTAFMVGQARGVILLTASQLKIPVSEVTPLQVKQSLTTYGRADKQQVQKMVKILLDLKEVPKSDDAADALAVAICAASFFY